jgi:hypothetical protein
MGRFMVNSFYFLAGPHPRSMMLQKIREFIAAAPASRQEKNKV